MCLYKQMHPGTRKFIMDVARKTDQQLINGAYTIHIHVKEFNGLLLCLVSLYLQET